ncbi:response regulator [Desulfonatronovibrio magnus]|uniref:response regulator n=1 Tax=Desulfonatronovibrio magnus TaxID=698827 RepID=UPI0005EBE7A1|nr:response regulator [Desulfonatronovibrio magnus]
MAKILIVEDSAFQRTIIKRIVSNAGHEVMEADSGREALRLIEAKQPDLVFLDLLMPDINGFQVLKVLKSKHSTVPVVVVTADVQETTRQRCEEDGVRQIVYKPVDENKISSVLKSVLGS